MISRRKNFTLIISLCVLLFTLICVCAACTQPAKKPSVKLPPVSERNGYVEEYPTLNGIVKRFPNKKGLSIYARLFTPKDFDENKSYGILIMSHGNNTVSADGRNSVVKETVENGMLAISFDFCEATRAGKSEGTPDTATNDDEANDLLCVLDYVKTLKFVDKSKIALWGQSRGGAVTALAIGRCKNDIAAIVLQAPAVSAYEGQNGNLSQELKNYGKKICVLWGDADDSVKISNAYDLQEFMGEELMELHVIEGAPHSLQPDDYKVALPFVNAYLRAMGVMPAAAATVA